MVFGRMSDEGSSLVLLTSFTSALIHCHQHRHPLIFCADWPLLFHILLSSPIFMVFSKSLQKSATTLVDEVTKKIFKSDKKKLFRPKYFCNLN